MGKVEGLGEKGEGFRVGKGERVYGWGKRVEDSWCGKSKSRKMCKGYGCGKGKRVEGSWCGKRCKGLGRGKG
jgi:hypothetical protein